MNVVFLFPSGNISLREEIRKGIPLREFPLLQHDDSLSWRRSRAVDSSLPGRCQKMIFKKAGKKEEFHENSFFPPPPIHNGIQAAERRNNASGISSPPPENIRRGDFFQKTGPVTPAQQISSVSSCCLLDFVDDEGKQGGVPGGDRTPDPLLRRQLLYPLSYRDS